MFSTEAKILGLAGRQLGFETKIVGLARMRNSCEEKIVSLASSKIGLDSMKTFAKLKLALKNETVRFKLRSRRFKKK